MKSLAMLPQKCACRSIFANVSYVINACSTRASRRLTSSTADFAYCRGKLSTRLFKDRSSYSQCAPRGFVSTADSAGSSCAPALTKDRAKSLVLKLTEEERNVLSSSLKEFEAELMKEQYKGQLAAFRWRSKFGRPSSVPNLGDVDPTGSYCPVPEDWLLKKYTETVPKPTTSQLLSVALVNSVPFVGFGFLDNSVMIVCGDYIEATLGSVVVVTTMAAAALGNTFSDIIGIGSAYYVELAASKIGIKPPPLSPIQLDMSSCRVASNLGRVIGVTIGCILGMSPLLFIKKEGEEKEKEENVVLTDS